MTGDSFLHDFVILQTYFSSSAIPYCTLHAPRPVQLRMSQDQKHGIGINNCARLIAMNFFNRLAALDYPTVIPRQHWMMSPRIRDGQSVV